ncbi:MAG: hypothetical protein JXL80_16885 [Planctomycetes bacterium]|nr:hypothetical protein [Planctomycetota bacterium]
MAIVYGLSLWRRTMACDPKFCVDTSDLKLVQQTSWMTPEIADEISASLACLPPRLSLMDHTASRRVAECLEANPWIRKVYHVRLDSPKVAGQSNGLEVSMGFRRPVAFVEIGKGNQARYVMVDGEGVRLGDRQYLDPELGDRRLVVLTGVPTLPPEPGVVWADAAVIGGAQVADLLKNRVADFGVCRIDVGNVEKRLDRREPEIVLYTKRSVTRIVWGKPPCREAELLENITARGKIQLLDQAYEKFGGLHEAVEEVNLVLRSVRPYRGPQRNTATIRG